MGGVCKQRLPLSLCRDPAAERGLLHLEQPALSPCGRPSLRGAWARSALADPPPRPVLAATRLRTGDAQRCGDAAGHHSWPSPGSQHQRQPKGEHRVSHPFSHSHTPATEEGEITGSNRRRQIAEAAPAASPRKRTRGRGVAGRGSGCASSHQLPCPGLWAVSRQQWMGPVTQRREGEWCVPVPRGKLQQGLVLSAAAVLGVLCRQASAFCQRCGLLGALVVVSHP